MSPITLVRHVHGKPRPALLDPAVHWGAAVREGFDSGPPVPLWRVQVPTHIDQPPLPSEPLSCYLARRAEELNLPLSRTAHSSQESWHSGPCPFA